MNKKVLFSTLASIALVSCSDDALVEKVANAPVKEGIKVDFTLDEATRVLWSTDANVASSNSFTYEGTEEFSLFDVEGQPDNADLCPTSNALYQKLAGQDKYTSPNVVYLGEHFILLPADKSYVDPTSALVVKVPTSKGAEQDGEETIGHRTLFVSNSIDIQASTLTHENEAGYNKTINAQIHNITSAFMFKNNYVSMPEAGQTEPIRLQKISVAAPAGSDVFYTDGTLQKNAGKTTFVGGNTARQITAKYASNPAVGANGEAAISFLPTAAEASDNCYFVVVETNYGKVVVNKAADVTNKDGKIQTKDGAVTKTTSNANDGLSFKTEVTSISTQAGNGNRIIRNVNVDMSKLNMDSLHIKNSEQLVNVLKVYDKIKANQKATINLFLDGDSNNKFLMTPAAQEAYAKHLNMTGKTINFTPCGTTGEKCTTVVFENSGVELPSYMIFGLDVANGMAATAVEFSGSWNYTKQVEKTVNVAKLTVANGSTISVKGECGLKAYDAAPDFYNKGTMIVNNIAYLRDINFTNFGLVNIPASSELRVRSQFTNDATGREDSKQGKIENAGVLATVVSNGGVINNYGTIKKIGDASKTYVTTNNLGGDFGAVWSSTNKMGTIILNSKDDDNYSVSDSMNEGFIKLYVNKSSINGGDLGSEANYIVVDGAATTFTYSLPAYARIKFVEFNNTNECVWYSTSYNAWTAVVVNKDKKVNIKKDNAVVASYSCVNGTIYNGGYFNGGVIAPTYFGSYVLAEHVLAY